MQRRGALGVSTNAIVTLIVAVVVLGLIIALVMALWPDDIVLPEPHPGNPSSSQPITYTLPSSNYDRGTTYGMYVKVLNIGAAEAELSPGINCLNIQVPTQVIPAILGPGETHEFLVQFTIANTATSGSHVCQLVVENVGSTDFSLSVN